MLGLIFDVDGLLVDTEPVIAEATIRMFRELYAVDMTPGDFTPFIGTGAVRYVVGPAEQYGVDIDLEKALQARHDNFVALLREGGDISLPGAHTLINAAAEHPGWKLALATSSPGEKSRETLEAAHIDPALFDVWVHGDMIVHKKPHPEIYLRAAQELGLSPALCVAVEDAVTGTASAKAAGMACVAVTNSFTAEELAEADLIVASLEELTLEKLAHLIGHE
jgi:HAD superfamily hydrolase (TIGR01509 family)